MPKIIDPGREQISVGARPSMILKGRMNVWITIGLGKGCRSTLLDLDKALEFAEGIIAEVRAAGRVVEKAG